jgi:hypothetical protein
MIEAGVVHLHEVGKSEAAFKSPRRDLAVEKTSIVLSVGLEAADGQLVVLGSDLDVVWPEPGDGKVVW